MIILSPQDAAERQKMQNLRAKMKAVSRRISHLRSRIEDSTISSKSIAYDKAEASALTDLLRVAAVYNEARGQDGSHVENTLYMVRDVIDDTLDTCGPNLDLETKDRLKSAWEKCSESIRVIRKLADDVDEDS